MTSPKPPAAGTGPRLFLRLGLFFLFAPLLSGCMIKEGHTELGPFYYHRPLPEGEGAESAVLWPFLQSHSSPGVRQFAFRPLLNWRTEETSGLRGNVFEVQALWPLFLYRRTEGVNRLKTRLYPVFFHRRFQRPEGELETDTAFLPLLFAGDSEKLGSYFALFPFGGVLKGFFSQDKIRFFLFPLYAEAWKGEHHSRHILWPIFKYGKGGGRSSLRVFPFFGWKEKENWNKKLFILWPFFARVQEWLGTEHPTDSWFFLPFYGRQQTPFGRISYYLFPFFSYQRNERPGNRYRAWTMPWPFYQGMRGDRYWKTAFWPFWGRYRVGDHYEKEILAYPFYSSFATHTPRTLSRRRYILPLYWDRHIFDLDGKELEKRLKLWPFFELESDREKNSHFQFLSPLWFRNPEGMERNYSDFWTLYRHETIAAAGMEVHRVLWYRWAGENHDAEPAPQPREGQLRDNAGEQRPEAADEVDFRRPEGYERGEGEERLIEPPPGSPHEEILSDIPWVRKLWEPFPENQGSKP